MRLQVLRSVFRSPGSRSRDVAADDRAVCITSRNSWVVRFHRFVMTVVSSSNLKRAVWPIEHILAHPKMYQKSVDLRRTKLYGNFSVESLVNLYSQLRSARKDRQAAAAQRNLLLKEVNEARAVSSGSINRGLLERSKELKLKLAEMDKRLGEMEDLYYRVVDSVPNIVEPSAAEIQGDFELIDMINPRQTAIDKSRDHVAIGRKLGIIDLESGSRVSGAGSYFLVGAGALLENALVQYALKKCMNHGLKIVNPPSIVREEFTAACGFKPRDDDNVVQVYRVQGGGGPNADPFCLAGTAEIPLASQLAHTRIDLSNSNSLTHAGVSRSFRAEAGSRGTVTRGLYRVHEFTKVEMFMWTAPEIVVSDAALHWLLKIQTEIIQELGLTARVINIAPTDLGAPAYQKFDIEVWMPGRGDWGEVSSASNCLDFQSRRLHTVDEKGRYVHTLNATALAVPRIILALIENGWNAALKRVELPESLHSFCGPYIQ